MTSKEVETTINNLIHNGELHQKNIEILWDNTKILERKIKKQMEIINLLQRKLDLANERIDNLITWVTK